MEPEAVEAEIEEVVSDKAAVEIGKAEEANGNEVALHHDDKALSQM